MTVYGYFSTPTSSSYYYYSKTTIYCTMQTINKVLSIKIVSALMKYFKVAMDFALITFIYSKLLKAIKKYK